MSTLTCQTATDDCISRWYRGRYYTSKTELAEAQRKRRQELKAEKQAAIERERARTEELRLYNAQYTPAAASFFEGFRNGQMLLADKRDAKRVTKDTAWGKNLHIVFNPEQRCCYCGEGIPTNRVWFFNQDRTKVLLVIDLKTGSGVPNSGWHPHVNGTSICRGGDNSVDGVQAMFLGLNPGSAFMDVKNWLKTQLGHVCWWSARLPHYVDPGYRRAGCGCAKCAYCALPICQCIPNQLERRYSISHPIEESKPIPRKTFDDFVKWAEEVRQIDGWSEEQVRANAGVMARLRVEPPMEAPIEPPVAVEQPETPETPINSASGSTEPLPAGYYPATIRRNA